MQKNHVLLLKKIKNSESAQLCSECLRCVDNKKIGYLMDRQDLVVPPDPVGPFGARARAPSVRALRQAQEKPTRAAQNFAQPEALFRVRR